MPAPIRHKVYSKINKGTDMQLHVKVTKADGLELVNLRDFIVSQKKEGRGVVFESYLLPDVIEALTELHRQIGSGRPLVHEGQGVLAGMENV